MVSLIKRTIGGVKAKANSTDNIWVNYVDLNNEYVLLNGSGAGEGGQQIDFATDSEVAAAFQALANRYRRA